MSMATYSDCHFAETMSGYITIKSIGARREEIVRCSFCGNRCGMIEGPLALNADVELTIRRWSDGDCSLDDMFLRINKELSRSWGIAAQAARTALQAGGEPEFSMNPVTGMWTKREEDGDV